MQALDTAPERKEPTVEYWNEWKRIILNSAKTQRIRAYVFLLLADSQQ